MSRTRPASPLPQSRMSSASLWASDSSSAPRWTSTRPAKVNDTPRGERSNTRIPSEASSDEMRTLAAASARPSRSLPPLIEPASATASTNRKVCKSRGALMWVRYP